MTAGVPGAGIAGLFYLAAALLAPLWQVAGPCRPGSHRRPWRFVLRLAGLALSMLGGIYVAGLGIGAALTAPAALEQAPAAAFGSSATPQFIAAAAVLLTFGTLAAVLVGVEVLSLAVRSRATVAPSAASVPEPAATRPHDPHAPGL